MKIQFAIFLIVCNGAMLRGLEDTNKEQVLERIRLAVKTNTSKHHHKAYDTLAYYVDTFGPRMWGSKSMALAVDALYQELSKVGFDKVYKENLGEINAWQRGEESLILKSPRKQDAKLNLIGLGLGKKGDVNGEVIVVNSFDDLTAQKDKVTGKIVCFNVPWKSYGYNVQYRIFAAEKAQQYGAIGVLLRSVASSSLDSPHTGTTSLNNNIPIAAISLEDAEMFQRMQDRGQKIVVELKLDSSFFKTTSDNVIAEIKGTTYPDQIVLMGGHWDSWDTGSQTGANDDGGGAITCLEALRLLKDLGIKPKRTIRFIAWSGEEMQLPKNGAEVYAELHKNENHILAFESDLGNTKPYGFGYDAKSVRSTQIVAQLAQNYLHPIRADLIVPGEGESTDAGYVNAIQGTPLMRNLIDDNETNDFYFRYHHSAGDSMSMMDADALDDNVVAIASMMYLIADNDETIQK